MDLYRLFEPDVATHALQLIHRVLETAPFFASDEDEERKNQARDQPVRAFEVKSIGHLISYYNGDLASGLPSEETFQQRFPGFDAERTVRSPIVIHSLYREEYNFTRLFVKALHTLAPRLNWAEVTSTRKYTVIVCDSAGIAEAFRVKHQTSSASIDLTQQMRMCPDQLPPAVEAFQMTMLEKLVFLLLLLRTSATQKAFKQEFELPLKSLDSPHPSWLVGNTINSSMRMVLYPFLRWFCIGADNGLGRVPSIASLSYCPIPEDNNILVVHIGRIWSPLLSIEMVHRMTTPSVFGNDKQPCCLPDITGAIDCLVVTVMFMWYRFLCWMVGANHSRWTTSFPAFLKLALDNVLAETPILPDTLHDLRPFFLEMKSFFLTASFSKTSYGVYPRLALGEANGGAAWTSRRMLVCMVQIARVLHTRARTVQSGSPTHQWESVVYRYVPASSLATTYLPIMATMSIPTASFGVLIPGVSASALSWVFKPVRLLLHRSTLDPLVLPEWQLVDLFDSVRTNHEAACMIVISSLQFDLVRALAIYQKAVLIACGLWKPDTQYRLDFLGALGVSGVHLAHWLISFRLIMFANELQSIPEDDEEEDRPPTAQQIDLDLDSDSDDETEAPTRDSIVHVMPRVYRLCCKNAHLIHKLFHAAHTFPCGVKFLMCVVQGMACKEVHLTYNGFAALHQLLPGEWETQVYTFFGTTEEMKAKLKEVFEHPYLKEGVTNYLADRPVYYEKKDVEPASSWERTLSAALGRFMVLPERLVVWVMDQVLARLSKKKTSEDVRMDEAFKMLCQLRPIIPGDPSTLRLSMLTKRILPTDPAYLHVNDASCRIEQFNQLPHQANQPPTMRRLYQHELAGLLGVAVPTEPATSTPTSLSLLEGSWFTALWKGNVVDLDMESYQEATRRGDLAELNRNNNSMYD